jgi:hypothetical protein
MAASKNQTKGDVFSLEAEVIKQLWVLRRQLE